MDGQMQVRLVSADITGVLEKLQQNHILLRDVCANDALSVTFCICRKDWKQVRQICGSRGESVSAKRLPGLYWTVVGLLRRPVLVLGMLALLLLTLWVPGRIFFVQVEGNVSVPANRILEQAQLCGIGFGASRREVRSEQMKNHLLEQLPQLQWAAVNTKGCVAVITVLERQQSPQPEQEHQVSSIVALRDGIIREMTVQRGNALCTVGQAVKAGQVLISGYTDCGISIQASQAKGEIFGETKREMTAVFPLNYAKREMQHSSVKKYSLIIGKKRINFSNNSGILDGSCVKIYEQQSVILPGGFRLPITIVTETWISYTSETKSYAQPQQVLEPFMERYLLQTMVAGKILSRQEIVTETPEFIRIDGIYSCYEMIGITRVEERMKEYENH